MVLVWQYFIFHYFENKKTNILVLTKVNFLSRIYTDSEFNFVNSTISSLDYNSIENKIIVLNELDGIPQALQTTSRSFVENGGNLIVIPSEKTHTANLEQFLSNFGAIQFKLLNR
jgi:hypothetical protein